MPMPSNPAMLNKAVLFQESFPVLVQTGLWGVMGVL